MLGSENRSVLETAPHTIGSSRLRYVVNTHWYWDHDGREWMYAARATIVARRNTSTRCCAHHDFVVGDMSDEPLAPVGPPSIHCHRRQVYFRAANAIFNSGKRNACKTSLTHMANSLRRLR